MLETVQEYAREQLRACGEWELAQRLHAEYFLTWAEAAQDHLRGPEQAGWLMQYEAEHDNFRAALRWFLTQGKREQAPRLGVALWLFWDRHSHFQEGRGWLRQILEAMQHDSLWTMHPLKGRILVGAGMLAYRQGDYTDAKISHSESLAICRQHDEILGMSAALNNLGLIAGDQGEYAAAAEYYTESLAIKRISWRRKAT